MSILRQESQKRRNQDMANMYISGHTLETIGNKYGMSRQAVSQIFKRLNVPTRVKLGERASITNCINYSKDKLSNQTIESLVDLVEHYKAKHTKQYQRNIVMKKYYQQKLLSKLMEV